MTAQNIRFVYTDNTGTDQIVASTVGEGAEINRTTQFRNFRDVNKVKVWGGRGLFNAFPQQKNQFNTTEPEILMQEEVSGTWTTVGRFFAKDSGDIKDKESVAVTLYGFQRYVEKQDVSISNTITDIVDVAEKLPAEIEGSYVIESPAEADVDGGYPSVDGYSYNGKAETLIQELTRDYKWTMLFTDRTDGSGNNIIRFEPKGYGGAVDTLDSNTTGLVFDDWEKERTENIVNKVKVQGVDSNGNKVSATATNQDMIDKYGVKFEKVALKYIQTSTEAQQIAEERLKPGKDSNGNDITTPPEGGIVNLPTLTFRQGIENDSVNVVDSELNIDDAFTVNKHKLYYPSGRSELHLDFEDEKTEDRAAKDKYLGDRNNSLFPNQLRNAGLQSFSGDTGSAPSNTQRDPETGIDGDSQGENVNSVSLPLKEGVSLDTIDIQLTAPSSPAAQVTQNGDTSASYDGQALAVVVTNYAGDTMLNVDISVTNESDGGVQIGYASLRVDNRQSKIFNDFFNGSEVSQGDTIKVNFSENSIFGADFESSSNEIFFTNFKVLLISKSGHFLGDNIDTEDFNHGGTSDTNEHGTSGTTNTKNIKVSTEDKTDR